jgi:hypothetical protein
METGQTKNIRSGEAARERDTREQLEARVAAARERWAQLDRADAEVRERWQRLVRHGAACGPGPRGDRTEAARHEEGTP